MASFFACIVVSVVARVLRWLLRYIVKIKHLDISMTSKALKLSHLEFNVDLLQPLPTSHIKLLRLYCGSITIAMPWAPGDRIQLKSIRMVAWWTRELGIYPPATSIMSNARTTPPSGVQTLAMLIWRLLIRMQIAGPPPSLVCSVPICVPRRQGISAIPIVERQLDGRSGRISTRSLSRPPLLCRSPSTLGSVRCVAYHLSILATATTRALQDRFR